MITAEDMARELGVQFYPNKHRADWPKVITELAQATSIRAISAITGISEDPLRNYRKGLYEPSHSFGAALLALHEKFCANQQESNR